MTGPQNQQLSVVFLLLYTRKNNGRGLPGRCLFGMLLSFSFV